MGPSPCDTLISDQPSARVAESHLKDVRIRPVRPRDFAACARVCFRSLRDLARREGQPTPNFPARNLILFFRHALATDPRGFYVAVVRGKVVCYAITILRGKTHFLAQFFALPDAQSRCVVASLDFRAQALYAKFGMLPRTILYYVEGKPSKTAQGRIELRQVGPTGRSTKRA